MTNKKYFLGIDGGGTRTTAIVSDLKGNIICKLIGESINFNSVGLKKARINLKYIIDELQQKYHINYFDTAFIGMSALYKKAEDYEVELFTKDILYASTIYMNSDLYIALEGLMNDGPNMLVISGTGSMGIVRDNEDNIIVAGGWGYLLGDQGSAYYIAIEGIKRAIKAYEGFGEDTILIERIKTYYQLKDVRELIDMFYNPVMPRDKIAAFAKEVYECALKKDKVALQIIDDASIDLAEHAFALMNRINEYNITIGVYGGVFQSNELLFEAFKKRVTDKYENAIVKYPEFPPEVGAIFSCFKKNNMMISQEIINNICSAYIKAELSS